MEPLREDLRKTKRGQRQASLERSDGELGLQEVVSRELRLSSHCSLVDTAGGTPALW